MEIETKTKKETRNKYSIACAVVASTISVLMGYDTGVMSGAMMFIQEEFNASITQISVLAGILNLFALFGSLAAGRTSDVVGRRYTIVIACTIFFVGSVLMGLAPSYAMLLSGRCVAGVGVGFALLMAPVYSAEISSPSFRGSLTSLPEICISFGILLGYLSNYFFAKLPLAYGWRTMLGIAALPSVMLGVGILAMPESPRWLAMQGRLKEARNVLLKVSNSQDEANMRMQEIKSAVGIPEDCEDDYVEVRHSSKGGEGVWSELFLRPTPTVRRIVIAALGLHFLQHLTGIEAVVLYSPPIFKNAGIQSKDKLLLATVAVGFTKTVFILIAVFLVDRFGRKPLLLTSTAGAVVSLALLGVALTVIHHAGAGQGVEWAMALCIGMVLCYVAFFSIGLGPITWVYTSEVFPLRLRAQGASVCVGVNRVMNGGMSMLFPHLVRVMTIGGVFFMFSGIGVVAWVFYFLALPETKGRPLEEIQQLFGQGCFPGLAKSSAHDEEK